MTRKMIRYVVSLSASEFADWVRGGRLRANLRIWDGENVDLPLDRVSRLVHIECEAMTGQVEICLEWAEAFPGSYETPEGQFPTIADAVVEALPVAAPAIAAPRRRIIGDDE